MSHLATFIREQRQVKPILLMTHVIYGYPTIADSLQMMRTLLTKEVAILEVQFPFSDPVADGPVITHACHQALANQPSLARCLLDINALAEEFPSSKVLLMSYLNPLLQFGFDKLAKAMAPGVSGVIIPDLPIDKHAMLKPLVAAKIDPVWLMIPGMGTARIKMVSEHAQGLIYCVSRKGVTGKSSDSTTAKQVLSKTLNELKPLTDVPVALGFGIASAEQIQEIIGQVDVAVVGSALINAYIEGGLSAFSEKVDSLLAV